MKHKNKLICHYDPLKKLLESVDSSIFIMSKVGQRWFSWKDPNLYAFNFGPYIPIHVRQSWLSCNGLYPMVCCISTWYHFHPTCMQCNNSPMIYVWHELIPQAVFIVWAITGKALHADQTFARVNSSKYSKNMTCRPPYCWTRLSGLFC